MFDYHSKVDDYINGRLSESDSASFEYQMLVDDSLRKVVEEHDIYSGIADAIIDKKISKDIKTQMNGSTMKSNNRNKSLLYFLIGVVVSSILLGLIFLKPSKGELLYAEYYSSPMANGVRGDKADDDNIIKDCYKAHQELENNNIDVAKALFESSIIDQNLLCREKSLYYLGLILIKENNFEEARTYLELVNQDEESGYEFKANELLKSI